MSNRRLVGLCAALSLTFAALGTTVGVAVANHWFPDVPTAGWAHEAVSEVGAAGCATGFPDGSFDPTAEVKRQQFAFWMHNCGGRVGFATDDGTHDFITDGDSIEGIVELEVETGGAPGVGAGGYWLVTADIAVASSGAQQSDWTLQHDVLGFQDIDTERITIVQHGIIADPQQPSASGQLSMLARVAAGSTETFRVNVDRLNGAPNAVFEVTLMAEYYPFDGLGEAFIPT